MGLEVSEHGTFSSHQLKSEIQFLHLPLTNRPFHLLLTLNIELQQVERIKFNYSEDKIIVKAMESTSHEINTKKSLNFKHKSSKPKAITNAVRRFSLTDPG